MNVRNVLVLQLDNGREPFQEWFKKLDKLSRAVITSYIHRVALGGGRKHVKLLGDGISEIKIKYASGYRAYFGSNKGTITLVLGGNKGTQRRDISLAKKYWRTYNEKQ